jgi:hypothetical protein
MKKMYVQPSAVEYGNAAELIKGCGGWGCEVYLNNMSYCNQGGMCYDCHPGEWTDC